MLRRSALGTPVQGAGHEPGDAKPYLTVPRRPPPAPTCHAGACPPSRAGWCVCAELSLPTFLDLSRMAPPCSVTSTRSRRVNSITNVDHLRLHDPPEPFDHPPAAAPASAELHDS